MTSAIVLLVIFVLLIGMLYAGYRDGLFAATYALVRCTIAFLCAMTFFEPVASIMTDVISNKEPAPQYFAPIAFMAIFGIVMALGRWLKVTYTDPGIACPASVDHVAGPVVGLLHGVVFTGTLLIIWSLLPFPKYLPADAGRINAKLGVLDNGARMIKFYNFATGRMRGNTPFLLEDEPVLGRTQPDGGPPKPGESFTDRNGNGVWDRGWLYKYEHYADIDSTVLPIVAKKEPPPDVDK